MKRILFLATSLALCLPLQIKAANDADLLKSFRVTVWDNSSLGRIDAANKTITVKHIPNGQSVTGVVCKTAEGVTVSPDPNSLVGKWPEETIFTFTKGTESVSYKVIMADYVKDGSPENWDLIWNEEFNDGVIDYEVWSKVPRGNGFWHDTMTDEESLYEFQDGSLILWGKENPDTTVDKSKYLTGGLWGVDKKSFSLGRADIRAKFDNGKGFWPALWFLPQGCNEPYSGGGEMDMVEHLNFDSFVYMTVHTPYTNLVNKENPKNHVKAPFVPDEFNVYSIEVFTDKVVYLVNNKEVFSYPRIQTTEEKQFPFDVHDYYVILSAQLGGRWVGEVSLDGPVRLMVDYVRIYQTK